MGLIPKTLGTRPRLAVEIRPEGVVAARAEDAAAILTAVARGEAPGKQASEDRAHVIAAVKRALEAVAQKERQTSLVVPDAAVRVLLLEFEQLPPKPAEALAVVRFRLKKLLPFDADGAAISYQVMSQGKNLVRVLAVAVPAEVLAEYEGLVREAGFEPGAVLPSTLAACSALPETDDAILLVNACETSVTTAIVQGGVILLHRTVDLGGYVSTEEAVETTLPLVDVDASAGEWARQQPLTGYGVLDDQHISDEADFRARQLAETIAAETLAPLPASPAAGFLADQRHSTALEIAQALSVAAAYFEDTLDRAPSQILAAGTIGATQLDELLRDAGFGGGRMQVREMVEPEVLSGGAVGTRVPRGWMAGVRGALRN
jgi:type IV pilus assembly protein PilM